MNKKLSLTIGILVVAAILGMTIAPIIWPNAITAYDGPVAEVKSVNWPNNYGTVNSLVNKTDAYIYPVSPDILDLIVACGIRTEIMAAPNIVSTNPYQTINKTYTTIIDGVNKTVTEQWPVYKVKGQMQLTVSTYEGGLAQMKDATFTFRLGSNLDSIFSLPGDNFVYFVNVYTIDKAEGEGSMTVSPTAGGFDFIINPVGTDATPQWIIDSGALNTNAGKFTEVEFQIKVLSAVAGMAGVVRYESYKTFNIGFDLYLVGHYKQVKDTRGWDWPELPDFWGAIANVLLLIAGIFITILVVIKVPNPWAKVLTIVIVWLVLAIPLGWWAILGVG